MNGILVVDKPEGFTSFDVVAKMRGICRVKKIGHGGTLDPMATGVLPVFVGPAVKAVDLQPNQDKEYLATLRFGLATTTGDITGEVVKTGPSVVEEAALKATLATFVGARMQTPPMYSAVKVDGKPLYRYAREGKTVARQPRAVTFYSLGCLGQTPQGDWQLRIHCSKGTYVRTLAEELGHALGSCATLAGLRRTAAGVFNEGEAFKLEEIQKARDAGVLESLFVPVERVFSDIPGVQVGQEAEKRLLNGAAVYGVQGTSGRCRLITSRGFLGLGTLGEDGCLQAEKLFVEREEGCR